jgi:pimeloyl-ACP methyl ester carboxylesterase
MRRRIFAAAAALALAAPPAAAAQTEPRAPAAARNPQTRDAPGGSGMTTTATAAPAPRTGYAPVNGLHMYYELHGPDAGPPLVLLHGSFSGIGTSFGAVLPGLAAGRQVIGVELQAHGRTADIERPLRVEQLAEDTAALLRHLGIERADVFGYSMGAAVGLALGIRHPELVRKLVLASVTYDLAGVQPGLLAGLDGLEAAALAGTPWQQEYASVAPHPEHWPRLIEKYKDMNRHLVEWPADTIRALQAPVLILIGDADQTVPEHAVAMFRLLGGGGFGDTPAGLPNSQLAVLPGTSHVSLVSQTELLVSIIPRFLDAPVRDAG